MKAFKEPEMDIVYFTEKDVIVASNPCGCVDCGVCPPGKNDCACYDWTHSYSPKNE